MSDLLLASSDILPPLTSMPSNGNGSSMNVRLPSGNSISNGNIGIIPGVTRSATMNTMTGAMIGAPSLGSYPAGSPPLIRNVSTSRSTTQGGIGIFNTSDWRSSISVEERISLRKRLRDAYQKQCVDYQTLLDTVIAVDEELIFAAANNRLDYFKIAIGTLYMAFATGSCFYLLSDACYLLSFCDSDIAFLLFVCSAFLFFADWDARIKLKRQQLSGSTTLSDSTSKKRSLDDTMSILPLVTGEASNSVSSASTGTSIPVPAPIMTSANSESLFPTLSTGKDALTLTLCTNHHECTIIWYRPCLLQLLL